MIYHVDAYDLPKFLMIYQGWSLWSTSFSKNASFCSVFGKWLLGGLMLMIYLPLGGLKLMIYLPSRSAEINVFFFQKGWHLMIYLLLGGWCLWSTFVCFFLFVFSFLLFLYWPSFFGFCFCSCFSFVISLLLFFLLVVFLLALFLSFSFLLLLLWPGSNRKTERREGIKERKIGRTLTGACNNAPFSEGFLEAFSRLLSRRF